MKLGIVKIKEYISSNSKKLSVIICFGLALLYFITGFNKWFEIVVSCFAVISFVILPVNSSFCILFFLHNFLTSLIVWDLGFTITLVAFCFIVLVKYIVGALKKQYEISKSVIISFLVALAISLLTSINKTLYNGALLYLVYLPLIYLMFASRKNLNIREIVNFMLLGFVLSNIISVITMQIPNYAHNLGYSRYQAFSDNPNYLSMRALFLIIFYFAEYFNKKISLIKTMSIYIFSSVVILATQSKTAFVLLGLFSLIFIFLFLKQNFKKNIKWVGLFILICVIILFAFKSLVLQIFDRFIPDKNNLLNSLLTGRDEIWIMYFNECTKTPITLLFGNGLLTSEVFIPSQNMPRTSHSLYLFLLYRFGIVGYIALGVGFFFMIKKLIKNKTQFALSLPLLWFLLESLVDNTFLCFNITFLPLSLLFMFSSESSEKEN